MTDSCRHFEPSAFRKRPTPLAQPIALANQKRLPSAAAHRDSGHRTGHRSERISTLVRHTKTAKTPGKTPHSTSAPQSHWTRRRGLSHPLPRSLRHLHRRLVSKASTTGVNLGSLGTGFLPKSQKSGRHFAPFNKPHRKLHPSTQDQPRDSKGSSSRAVAKANDHLAIHRQVTLSLATPAPSPAHRVLAPSTSRDP